MKILLGILIAAGVYMALPSTMYCAVFRGIFGREAAKKADLHVWCRGNQALEMQYRQALEAFAGLPLEEVSVTSEDGLRLCGQWVNRGSDRLMVLVHGYRTRPEINFALQIQDFLALGYDLLIVDHRAHGKSEGRYCGMGHLEWKDVLKWIAWAPYEKVAVYGMSMGCAAVGHASGRMQDPKVRALVMDCGFSNFYDELNYKCDLWKMSRKGFAPAESWLAHSRLKIDLKENTRDSLARCTVPVFFIHGSADDEVPVGEMHRQYEACAAPKECMVVEGAPHALAYPLGGEEIKQRIAGFLNQYMR